MLDYIISLKTLLLAGAMGGVTGYLVSYLIENYFFEAKTDTEVINDTEVQMQSINNNYQRVVKVILWSMALICIWGGIFTLAAVVDYLLSFAPISHGMKFMENEDALTEFTWGFFAGMSTTLLKIGELAFAALKKD